LFRVTADDGVELQAQRWPASSPDAPVVLGLHGITANRLGLLPVLEQSNGEFELVTLDHRGRGLSDKPEDPASYGHRRNADDAAAVLRHLGLRDVIVVGQSMGAWVALQLAAHHPELVKAAVLVDGGFFPDLAPGETPKEHVDAIMGPGWEQRLTMTVPSADFVIDMFKAHPAFQGIWSDGLEEHLRAGLEVGPDGTARSRCSVVAAVHDSTDYFRPFGELPYVRADLPRVTCPVTLLRATAGFSISPETMAPMMAVEVCEQFQRELPQLQVQTVEGTNHYSIGYGPTGAAAVVEAIRKVM
jgi:pimeloyl-ACP methyl ester carboxylesterase